MVVALIAPRPLLLQTGDKDFWSDPKGEFLVAVAAEPVFKLLGKQGLGGGHETIPSDYDLFLRFLKMQLFEGK